MEFSRNMAMWQEYSEYRHEMSRKTRGKQPTNTMCSQKIGHGQQKHPGIRKVFRPCSSTIPGWKIAPGLWIDCGTPNQEGLGAPWSEVRIGSNHLYRKSQLCPASHAFPASRFPGRDFFLFPRQPCFRRGWQWGRLIENLRADPANETIQVATSVQKVGGNVWYHPPKKKLRLCCIPSSMRSMYVPICSIELTVHKLVYINILGLGHRRFWSCVMLTVQI